MRILIIDAQGGGLGKLLISGIKKDIKDAFITAVGTNSAATSAMLKAGADEAATGENSVVVCSKKADVIIGPMGMVIADSMLGEITDKMAYAIATSPAKRILIPFTSCDNIVVGVKDGSIGRLVADAIDKLKELC